MYFPSAHSGPGKSPERLHPRRRVRTLHTAESGRAGIGAMHEQINRLLELFEAVYQYLQDGSASFLKLKIFLRVREM